MKLSMIFVLSLTLLLGVSCGKKHKKKTVSTVSTGTCTSVIMDYDAIEKKLIASNNEASKEAVKLSAKKDLETLLSQMVKTNVNYCTYSKEGKEPVIISQASVSSKIEKLELELGLRK